jgi:ComEC/Rec2-related protein
MVFSKTLFLFTLFFLAGYYTPIHCTAQIWFAGIPAGVLLAVLGFRRAAILLICLVSLLHGALLDPNIEEPEDAAHFSGGVWGCTVQTTTTEGAILRTSSGVTAWAEDRELARSVRRGDSVSVLGTVNSGFIDVYAFEPFPSSGVHDRIRRSVNSAILSAIPSRMTSSLASALLVGERGDVPGYVRSLFRNTGTSHLLALSGLHVAIVSGFMLILFRKAFGKGWLAAAASILTVLIYIFISGARASTVRAGIMILAVLALCQSSGRTPDLLFVWSVAAILLVAFSGASILEDPGAQMSFSAVLSLIILGRSFQGRAGKVLSAAYAGMLVTVALAPMVSFRYGGFCPVAPIATVISIPFMLMTMTAGFLSLLSPFSAAASLLAEWIVFAWLGVLDILESGMLVFQRWMFFIWPVILLALWLFSRRSGFMRRFR